jgi:hypothetical protein
VTGVDDAAEPDVTAVAAGGTITYALQSDLDAAGDTIGVPVVAVPDPAPGEPGG